LPKAIEKPSTENPGVEEDIFKANFILSGVVQQVLLVELPVKN
jgi:hypothetical protein